MKLPLSLFVMPQWSVGGRQATEDATCIFLSLLKPSLWSAGFEGLGPIEPRMAVVIFSLNENASATTSLRSSWCRKFLTEMFILEACKAVVRANEEMPPYGAELYLRPLLIGIQVSGKTKQMIYFTIFAMPVGNYFGSDLVQPTVIQTNMTEHYMVQSALRWAVICSQSPTR